MKFNFTAVLTVGWVVAATACSPLHQTYWKHTDNGSASSLSAPQASAQLDKDVAACTSAINDMAKTSPVDPHDFDGCMLGEGWERQGGRQGAAMPQTWLKADNTQQDAKPARRVNMTETEKEQTDAIAHGVQRDNLVPPGGQISLGLQGYQDRYHESATSVNVHTNYFGAVAGYTYRDDSHHFWTIDGRAAHGSESYNSPSGTLSGVPDYEGEIRLTGGKDYPWDNSWISPYAGIGTRIFRGNGKGYFSSLGAYAYDRRIEQLYAPIGATWRTLLPAQLTLASTLEVDPLLIGSVNSRLQNGGGPNVVNTQDLFSGYGVRGDMMFGIPMETKTIELGPFFRYWNVNDSTFNIQSCGGGSCLVDLEPYNTRLQIGVTTRISF